MRRNVQIISHTADVGLMVRGRTLSHLFQNAAVGMTSLISKPNSFLPKKIHTISVSATDWESLLVQWLNEILYLFFVKKIGFFKFKIEKISPYQIKSFAWGEPLDLKRHEIYKEIKAVTYHHLKVKKTKSGYSTKIIFDI